MSIVEKLNDCGKSGRRHIFSSGGCGDSLIVGSKAVQQHENFSWDHFELHKCHKEAILDIMRCFTPEAKVDIVKPAHKTMLEKCKAIGGQYIDTKISSWQNPKLDKQIGSSIISGHVVIHVTAGRIGDYSERNITIGLIDQVKELFPNKELVLLGPKEITYDKCMNLTGKTTSVLETLSYINDCSLCIAHDGLVAYYSALRGHKTMINYHHDSLPSHYWNDLWSNHCVSFVGQNNFNAIPNNPVVNNFLRCIS